MQSETAPKTNIDWPTWIPFITAILYFCYWTFEFFACKQLGIPSEFIQISTTNLLFFSAFVIVASILLSLIISIVMVVLIEFEWFWALFLLGSGIVTFLLFLFFSVGDINWQYAIIILCWIVGVWLCFFTIGFAVRKTYSSKLLKFPIHFLFVNADEIVHQMNTIFQEKSFKMYLRICFSIISLILVSGISGFSLFRIYPPNTEIVGAENLVILRQYYQKLICRYFNPKDSILSDKSFPDVSCICAGGTKIATAFLAGFGLFCVCGFLPDHIFFTTLVKNKVAQLPANFKNSILDSHNFGIFA